MSDLDQKDDPTLAALLRTTGRRPPVPTDRADRVEATVRAHWHAELRRRSWRRRAFAAAALAAAATIAVAIGVGMPQRTQLPSGPAIAALVEMVVDSAWSQPVSAAPNGSPLSLRPGDEVEVGSELATEGASRLALRMATGHSLRLDANTRVRVLSDRAIALDRGAVYVDSRGPAGAAVGVVEIRTPLGSIRDIGTQFEVRRLAASLRVRVREGAITVAGVDTSVEVSAGQELELGEDGRATRRDSTAFGGEWLWMSEVTPMLEVEGRSLQEFLDWIARERGLRLEFASKNVAASAPRITLSGSIDGMTLDQALESVLPTCRMSHRIDGNVLLVRSSSKPGEPS